nr:transposase [Roseococcus sp. MDT2-1-1]
MIRKAHVFRLDPTPEQAAVLWAWIGSVRCVYNLALEQRRDWYQPGRRFNFASQCREVTALRAEFDWLQDVPVHPLQQAVKDLDRAYQNWWEGRARAPTPRKRGKNDAMRFPDPATFAFRRLSRRVGELKLPKLGWVRLRWDREIPGEVKNITVSRRAGLWQIAAQYELEIADPAPSALPVVGIDRGVNVFAALSDGTMIEPANCGKKALRALARAQRKLARKKRGSNNRRKQVRRVARLHLCVSNARKDFLHKVSTAIAKNHGVVVLEKLEVRNMVRSAAGTVEEPGTNVRAKSGLNRAILDQGWGMFDRFLGYKLPERSGRTAHVPARNSSRECSACGLVDERNRQGSRFLCVRCGHVEHADLNAAKVIKRRWGTPLLPVEGGRKAPAEAGTSQRAAA